MKGRRNPLRSGVAALLLAALVLPVAGEAARQGADDADSSPRLNAYARGRLAESDGALQDAAAAFRVALNGDPASPDVARRSYRQAVMAGDIALALKSAAILDKAGELPRDGVVLLLIDALQRRRADDARALTDRLEAEENLAYLGPFMRSWASMIDGPYDPPVIPVDRPWAVFAVRYVEEQLMLQRLARGDVAGARESLTVARERKTAFLPQQRITLALRFAALGDKASAIALLSEDRNHDYAAARAQIESGKFPAPDRLTPLAGLAALLQRLAADLSGDRPDIAVLSIVRLASLADPADPDIRLAVARTALSLGYFGTAYAQAGMIAPGSILWIDAQSVRMTALLRQERAKEAIAIARQIAARPEAGVSERRLLANVLLQSDDVAGAAEVLAQAVALPGGDQDASLQFQYGAALEQAGQWDKALPMLEKALALAPESPVVLNHLGYALADRGQDLPRAITLLEKANRIRPDEPALVDSLGWAYFRAGQPEKALPLLEKAVIAEPGNPELNEHLGDVLMALGRKFEARQAWAAARAVVEDDAVVRARIEAKLQPGGTPATKAPPTAPTL